MSSPVHHAKDLDVALTYAPPWAREPAEPLATLPAAPTIERPLRSGRPGKAGDRAVLELRRQLALNPEKIPEPPMARDHGGGSIALRICALIGAAALVAWAVIALPGTKHAAVDKAQADFPVKPTADPGKPYQSSLLTAPWLSVHDVQGQMNKPLSAGIQLEGDAVGATVTLSGLAADTRLSAGQPSGTTAWRVGAADLDGLMIQPPEAFVGAMDVTVQLQLADDRAADSQVVHFAWLGPAEASPAPPPAAELPPQQSGHLVLESEEIATLVKRGKELLENGDLASARLLLRRAAEAGSASGALALGATFDPFVIRKLGAVGAQPDPTRARKWYQKAADLGSPVASQQLGKLAQAPQ